MTTYSESVANAGRVIAHAGRDLAMTIAAEGTRAAAEAAWFPGHRLTVEQIEARLTAMQDAARTERAA